MLDVIEAIRGYNAGRDPHRLALKLAAMRDNPFAFLRGSCALFYARLAPEATLDASPPVWACGDLHLENFGSYKGDNRLVYFDINDFDEAALAPAAFDLVRALASITVAGRALRWSDTDADDCRKAFVRAYALALQAGHARWVERDTARLLLRELLDGLRGRRRSQLLDRFTEPTGRARRRLRVDGRHALQASEREQERVRSLVDAFAATQDDPKFFKVLDVQRHVAGTASLGLERYIVLVKGKGAPDGHYLLDLKAAMPSSLLPRLALAQPTWATQAQRVVELQRRLQAVPAAFLHALARGRRSFVLRDLQPAEDRVRLAAANADHAQLRSLMEDFGCIAAWAHLRGAGRQGSAIADELIAHGQARRRWQAALLRAARESARQLDADWLVFRAACRQGAFGALR